MPGKDRLRKVAGNRFFWSRALGAGEMLMKERQETFSFRRDKLTLQKFILSLPLLILPHRDIP